MVVCNEMMFRRDKILFKHILLFEQLNLLTVTLNSLIDGPISNIFQMFWALAGKLEEAIESLTEAIILNPTSAIMYANRGMT